MRVKLLIVSICLLFTLAVNSQIDSTKVKKNEIQFTFSPSKSGTGIIYSYSRLLSSVEIATPKIEEEQIKMLKYGLGFKVIDNYFKKYTIDVLGVYNHIYYYEGYRDILNPDNISKFSLEMGLSIFFDNNLVISFHYDILNYDAKLGFGLKF